MARSKRDSFFTPTWGRTIERVAIATLAALATRDKNIDFTLAAIAIFAIVAVGEEVGRGWIWRGKRVSIRDLAYTAFNRRRLRRARNKPGRKRRRGRSRVGKGIRVKVPGAMHEINR